MEPLAGPLGILTPITGTETSRRAAEVAIVLARASHCPITALYVAPGGKNKKRSRQYEEAILKDIVGIGRNLGVEMRNGHWRPDVAPERSHPEGNGAPQAYSDRPWRQPSPGRKAILRRHRRRVDGESERSLLFVAS